MKAFRIISIIALAVMLFISIDLGFNFLHSLIPELQDGISSYSVLQRMFGIFGDSGWTKAKFFFAFVNAVWVTFFVVLVNIALTIIAITKK